MEKVREVLIQAKRARVRERGLPAHVVAYYAIALAAYMRSSYREVLRCLLEGVQWLLDPSATLKVAGKSGISQARSRLGPEPLRKLYEWVVAPIVEKRTRLRSAARGHHPAHRDPRPLLRVPNQTYGYDDMDNDGSTHRVSTKKNYFSKVRLTVEGGGAIDVRCDLDNNGKLTYEIGVGGRELHAINATFRASGQRVIIVHDMVSVYYLRANAVAGWSGNPILTMEGDTSCSHTCQAAGRGVLTRGCAAGHIADAPRRRSTAPGGNSARTWRLEVSGAWREGKPIALSNLRSHVIPSVNVTRPPGRWQTCDFRPVSRRSPWC